MEFLLMSILLLPEVLALLIFSVVMTYEKINPPKEPQPDKFTE